MDNLQINSLKRKLGQLYISLGVQQIRDNQSEFSSGVKDETGFTVPLNRIDSNITFTPLDTQYYFTSFDNWVKIIEVLNPIAQMFKWQAERFDCDNRANLMSSLCSLLFRINTCATVYCKVFDATTGVFKYLHNANLIVDDSSNIYLWDVDNGGLYQKITSNPVIMGNLRYNLINVRGY
jgi:hypothetical protein